MGLRLHDGAFVVLVSESEWRRAASLWEWPRVLAVAASPPALLTRKKQGKARRRRPSKGGCGRQGTACLRVVWRTLMGGR